MKSLNLPQTSDSIAAGIANLIRQYRPQEALQIQQSAGNLKGRYAYPGGIADYAREVLHTSATPDQEQFWRLLQTPPYKVLVRSANNTGKSYGAAVAVNHFFDTYDPGLVLTTAPTFDQVTDILWKEVRMQRMRAKQFNPSFPLCFSGPKEPRMETHAGHFAKGLTARDASSFHGKHGPAVLIVFDECHDDQTEVMTRDGWKLWSSVSMDDEFLTMDPATMVAEYRKPETIVARPHDGEMYLWDKHGSEFCVTPGHRMYCKTQHGKWGFRPISELRGGTKHQMHRTFKWMAADVEEFTIPGVVGDRKVWPERRVDMDAWMRFLGWFCSEGSIVFTPAGDACAVSITQADCGARLQIAESIKAIGYDFFESLNASTPQLVICDSGLARHLLSLGRGCIEKRVPRYVAECSSRQIGIFLDSYMNGDGYVARHRNKERRIFYTSSKAMAGDLQELILKCGGQSTCLVRMKAGTKSKPLADGRIITAKHDGYAVSWSTSHEKCSYTAAKVKKVRYNGLVYCASVPPHHLLLTRRSGKPIWSGNCQGIAPQFWEAAESMLGGNVYGFLGIYNPLDTSSQVVQEETAPGYHPVMTMSALNHPNVQAGLRGEPPPIPSAIQWTRFREQVQKWCEPIPEADATETDVLIDETKIGGKRQWWRPGIAAESRLFGRWQSRPEDSVWSNFALDQMLSAAAKAMDDRGPIQIGVDVARFGSDNTCFVVRKGCVALHAEDHNGWSTDRTASRAIELAGRFASKYNIPPKIIPIVVDDNGVGGGVTDQIIMDGWNCVPVNCQICPDSLKEENQYPDIRSFLWFGVAEAASRGAVSIARLPADIVQELKGELRVPRYKMDNKGRRVVESKADIKKRTNGKSPDLADAFNLAFLPVSAVTGGEKYVGSVRVAQ